MNETYVSSYTDYTSKTYYYPIYKRKKDINGFASILNLDPKKLKKFLLQKYNGVPSTYTNKILFNSLEEAKRVIEYFESIELANTLQGGN